MRRNTIIGLVLLSFTLTAVISVLSSCNAKKPADTAVESLEDNSARPPADDKMSWENIPRQFFSSF